MAALIQNISLMAPRARVVSVLLKILQNPYRFTRRELERHFGVSKDTIEGDFGALRNAGLRLETDRQYRYALLPERPNRALNFLQPLTDYDRSLFDSLLRYLPDKDRRYLLHKLNALYDLNLFELQTIDEAAIERKKLLHDAIQQKVQVVLKNYRSRSNDVRDRQVEPFYIDVSSDVLQAFDPVAKDTRHYRLSRIEQVVVTNLPWVYTNHHRAKITDVFRIADNQQLQVRLTIDVFAYNSLTEEFPQAIYHLSVGTLPNTWIFEGPVNHGFKGITNFILSNAAHVDIHGPDALRVHIRQTAIDISKKF